MWIFFLWNAKKTFLKGSLWKYQMATHASSVSNICCLRGKGIGGVTADLLTPEKEDGNDTKALADLSKTAKHLESAEVEASNLKRKFSQQGTKTTKKAQTGNILIDEETKEGFEWVKEEMAGFHPICIEIQKQVWDDSEFGDCKPLLFDYRIPVEEIKYGIDDIKKFELEMETEMVPLRLEPEFLPLPNVSPTSGETCISILEEGIERNDTEPE